MLLWLIFLITCYLLCTRNHFYSFSFLVYVSFIYNAKCCFVYQETPINTYLHPLISLAEKKFIDTVQVEKMEEIAKLKAKEEKKRLESEVMTLISL